MEKLIKELGISESQLKQILLAKRKVNPKVLKRYLSDKELKFGIISDTHLCSRHECLNELHTFYAICKKVGVKMVFHAGDLVDGSGRIYRNQLNEIHTYGAMRQAEYVIKNYPKVAGITTYFCTGNHCLSFYAENGVDIGQLVAAKRPDMVYLGQYNAEIVVNRVKIRLIHPQQAGAYAISYHLQRFIEQMASGTKPDILIRGHEHTAIYFFHRNIHAFNAGTFQKQTDYQLRRGLNPSIGGWICEIKEGKKKDRVVAMQSCFIPFFV